jgi:GDP-L-fucose synthase
MHNLEEYHEKESLILSVNEKEEISIREVATLIAREFNYEKRMRFDTSFADGQFKKTADNSKLMKYIPTFEFTSMKNGLQKSIQWFCQNYESCRK